MNLRHWLDHFFGPVSEVLTIDYAALGTTDVRDAKRAEAEAKYQKPFVVPRIQRRTPPSERLKALNNTNVVHLRRKM